jgi:GNAT superfamily N-acetyltransferase
VGDYSPVCSVRDMSVGMRVMIRPRTDADLEGCERLARAVHDLDGYPPYLPGDLRSFVASLGAIAAWVAEVDSDLVGHVALHPDSSDAVMNFASQVTGQPADRFGVVARLLVSLATRREGVGRSLLDTAAAHAVDRGLRSVLDVATGFRGAIRLYESCGWVRAGMVSVRMNADFTLDEYVYLASPGAS